MSSLSQKKSRPESRDCQGVTAPPTAGVFLTQRGGLPLRSSLRALCALCGFSLFVLWRPWRPIPRHRRGSARLRAGLAVHSSLFSAPSAVFLFFAVGSTLTAHRSFRAPGERQPLSVSLYSRPMIMPPPYSPAAAARKGPWFLLRGPRGRSRHWFWGGNIFKQGDLHLSSGEALKKTNSV